MRSQAATWACEWTRRGWAGCARLAHAFNRMTAELELADRRRRNLTADVAHELRTPLHVIQGNLEGVLDGVYEPSHAHIEATLAETRQLARLIEDLRVLSLAEAGELPLASEPVDVVELLTDVQTSFSGQAEVAGIDLRVEAPPGRLVVQGDAGRLDQVFSNLVANALRYTRPRAGRSYWRRGLRRGASKSRCATRGKAFRPRTCPTCSTGFGGVIRRASGGPAGAAWGWRSLASWCGRTRARSR